MDVSFVGIFTIIISLLSAILALFIFRKLYSVKHKRPWLYIAISSIILLIKEILQILKINIYNSTLTELIIYILEFISIASIFLALLLEYLIIKYYKGRFVKIKFIPIQEGTLSEEVDLEISSGEGYLAYKKDRSYLIEEFSKAVKAGFHGFLLVEKPPRQIREQFGIEKSPIAWIFQTTDTSSKFIKENLTENSDIVEPIKVNEIINYIEMFLEESNKPFILLELNEILRLNPAPVVIELLSYIVEKIKTKNGVFIGLLNRDIDPTDLASLKEILKDLN